MHTEATLTANANILFMEVEYLGIVRAVMRGEQRMEKTDKQTRMHALHADASGLQYKKSVCV